MVSEFLLKATLIVLGIIVAVIIATNILDQMISESCIVNQVSDLRFWEEKATSLNPGESLKENITLRSCVIGMEGTSDECKYTILYKTFFEKKEHCEEKTNENIEWRIYEDPNDDDNNIFGRVELKIEKKNNKVILSVYE